METGICPQCGGAVRGAGPAVGRPPPPEDASGHSTAANAIVKVGSGALGLLLSAWSMFFGCDHVVNAVREIVSPADEVCGEFKSAHLDAVITFPGCWLHRPANDEAGSVAMEQGVGQKLGRKLSATEIAALGSVTFRVSEFRRGFSVASFGNRLFVERMVFTSWQLRGVLRDNLVGAAKDAAAGVVANMTKLSPFTSLDVRSCGSASGGSRSGAVCSGVGRIHGVKTSFVVQVFPTAEGLGMLVFFSTEPPETATAEAAGIAGGITWRPVVSGPGGGTQAHAPGKRVEPTDVPRGDSLAAPVQDEAVRDRNPTPAGQPPPPGTGFFEYTREDGTTIYTDEWSRVPQKYRANAKRVSDGSESGQ